MNNAELEQFMKSQTKEQQQRIHENKNKLIGTHHTTMKHVGGIVFHYDTPNINKSGIINVTMDDKKTISSNKTFKIDILSSRSLAILRECNPHLTNDGLTNIDLSLPIFHHIFATGNNMGLVLAESVLMKRAFMRYKPKTIEQLAWCFAIVRPMAKVARDTAYGDIIAEDIPSIVYDDDVLLYISNTMDVDIGEADTIRRKISKGDKPTITLMMYQLLRKYKKKHPKCTEQEAEKYIQQHLDLMTRLTEYGFCKSHSISYAMMIWHLAKQKWENPKVFWKACINHADSSYRPWVHLSEAVYVGVDLNDETLTHNQQSVYSKIRQKNILEQMKQISEREQLIHYGYWLGLHKGLYYDNCYFERIPNVYPTKWKFRGILGAIRTSQSYKNKKQSGYLLGTGFQRYLDLIVKNMTFFDTKKYVGIEGICTLSCKEEDIYITDKYTLF